MSRSWWAHSTYQGNVISLVMQKVTAMSSGRQYCQCCTRCTAAVETAESRKLFSKYFIQNWIKSQEVCKYNIVAKPVLWIMNNALTWNKPPNIGFRICCSANQVAHVLLFINKQRCWESNTTHCWYPWSAKTVSEDCHAMICLYPLPSWNTHNCAYCFQNTGYRPQTTDHGSRTCSGGCTITTS